MYYVYAILSESRKYIYVGLTDDVDRRVQQHNSGYEQTTKPYIPFKLIYTEAFTTREEARKREKYFKSGAGKKRLKAIIAGK